MKSSKKTMLIGLFTIALMLGASTYDAFAFQRHRNPNGHQGGGGNNVGAPLDGGILTLLLGGAGAAYVAFKKKKNQK